MDSQVSCKHTRPWMGQWGSSRTPPQSHTAFLCSLDRTGTGKGERLDGYCPINRLIRNNGNQKEILFLILSSNSTRQHIATRFTAVFEENKCTHTRPHKNALKRCIYIPQTYSPFVLIKPLDSVGFIGIVRAKPRQSSCGMEARRSMVCKLPVLYCSIKPGIRLRDGSFFQQDNNMKTQPERR